MSHHVVWWKLTDVSKVFTASIITAMNMDDVSNKHV